MRPLRRKDHEEREVSARVGEKQRRRHRPDDRASDAQARENKFAAREIRRVPRNLLDGRRNVHRKVHHRAGRREDDRAREDVHEVEVDVAGVEERLHERHRRAVHVHRRREEVSEDKRGADAEHRPDERRKAFARRPGDEVHDDGRQDRHRGERDPRGAPAAEAERNEELPDRKAAEDETEERLRPGPSGEDNEQEDEAAEEDGHPAKAPVVARDEGIRPQDDERRVPDPELLVELHLRADLVVRVMDAAVRQTDLQLLRTELDESVNLQPRVVDLDDLGPRRLALRVRQLARPRQEAHADARRRQYDYRNDSSHRQLSANRQRPAATSPSPS